MQQPFNPLVQAISLRNKLANLTAGDVGYGKHTSPDQLHVIAEKDHLLVQFSDGGLDIHHAVVLPGAVPDYRLIYLVNMEKPEQGRIIPVLADQLALALARLLLW